MRLRVIAVDYDGTIAKHGAMAPGVREAIRKARLRGIIVVIVTGRILSELQQVVGSLEFVDGVVAENGAVVHLPNGHTSILGQKPPVSLLAALTEHGIVFKIGRCVVEMDSGSADIVIQLIQRLQLPLAIFFNAGRMMLLPHSISKSSGLKYLLDILGVSPHNALAIGDAENDHELLMCCEFGVTVEWGSPWLKENADYVIKGEGPQAVGKFIDEISLQLRMPSTKRSQRYLTLESLKGEPPFQINIRGRNILVAGDSNSGKSWLAGLLCEQMILQGYTVYVFDPEGDYGSLASLPNVATLGGKGLLPHMADLRAYLQQGLSLVLNLSHLTHEEKGAYIQTHLPLVAEYRREFGFPHRILLDECHYFLASSQQLSILDLELDSYILVTHRLSYLPDNLLQDIQVLVVTRLTDRNEVDTLQIAFGEGNRGQNWHRKLANLRVGEAALLPPSDEAEGEIRQFHIAPRLTKHIRHRTKYFDIPVAIERSFIFTDNGERIGEPSTTLGELAHKLAEIPKHVVIGHLKRRDFSNWIASVFGDLELSETVRNLESIYADTNDHAMFAKDLFEAIKNRYNE